METKEVFLNKPQADIHLVNANKTYCLWGRATGKSNGGIGPRIIHLFNQMPRAQIGFTAPSYKMAFGQILPNVLGFLQNEMNLFEGENYVIGRKPPDEWPQPIIPIFDHKYVLSFDNGCAMPVLSLEAEGTGNGFNLQANVGDEAKFFNEKKLKSEVIRAIRGGRAQFGHLPEFESQWYFSDKYNGDIEWILAKREKMDQGLINAVIRLQLEVNEMKAAPMNDSLQRKIVKYETILTQIRKKLVFVSEASAEENREILGDEFFENQKEDSTSIEYDVAIGNKDPDRTENSFYPQLSDENLYAANVDVDPSRPLIIALDYQWRISPIATAQIASLPPSPKGEGTGVRPLSLNFVFSCYTLHPEGISVAIDKWAHHFRNHPTKLVYYIFDKTATSKSPTAQPFYETVIECLRLHGWDIVAEHMGEPPLHNEKFKSINRQLHGEENTLPIRINQLRNQDMLRSIKLTAARQYNGKTAKDKTKEKNLSYPAVKATHFSDVFDMVIYGVLDLNLVPHNTNSGFGMIIS